MNKIKAAAALVAFLALGTAAQATPLLQMKVNGSLVAMSSPDLGTYQITSGVFRKSVLVATSDNQDLTSLIDLGATIFSSGKGTLTIELSETGILTPSPNWTFESAISDVTRSSSSLKVSYASFVDRADTAFAKTIALFSVASVPPNQTVAPEAVALQIQPPFSMTEIITITGSKSSDFASIDALISAVDPINPIPEPATLALLGVGLLGLSVVHRSRAL